MTTIEAEAKYNELKELFEENKITVEQFVDEYNDLLKKADPWDGPIKKKHEWT